MASVDFNRDIRPILSENCFQCHGPDENSREGGSIKTGGLRLDTFEGATTDIGGYAALVPGEPDESELIYLTESADEDFRMPPAEKGPRLDPDKIALLRQWIEEGGRYDLHWSYRKPKRPKVPGIAQADAELRNPIDHFIARKLQERGLRFSPEADPRDLARRAALDLTGLPPGPEEGEAFVRDTHPRAFARYVDNQLAKSAYGEHWARQWLDLARYADSAGYADDPLRTIWAFRDYVIRSFNENKPFDQFTIEQIAGDLLPNPTEDQVIATAFHRNTKTNSEGGTSDEEFRNEAIIDRVNTTMAVWMGTTIDCAQCHTHKYDPITQEDYFKVFAIFNNTKDEDRGDEKPLLPLYTESQTAERLKLQSESAALRAGIRSGLKQPEEKERRWAWERRLMKGSGWTVLRPGQPEMRANSKAPLQADEKGIITVGENSAPRDTYIITTGSGFPEKKVTGIRLEVPPHESPWVLNEFEVRLIEGEEPVFQEPADKNDADEEESYKQRLKIPKQTFWTASASYEREWYYLKDVFDGNSGDRFTGWSVQGRLDQPQEAVFEFSEPFLVPEGAKLQFRLVHNFPNKKLKRFRLSLTGEDDPMPAVPLTLTESLARPPAGRSADEEEALEAFFARHDPEAAVSLKRIAEIDDRLDRIEPLTTVPILQEVPADQLRRTFVQVRGNYKNLAEEVTPGVPDVFHSISNEEGPDRFALAHWLVDRENPLTARVVVNRYWEAIFGTGIVATSEEFGSQGELPSHPELLDWLAVELMESGWDVKHLLRLLVTSATYRQTSRVTPELLEKDPDNRWFSRGPRFRITAEMVRDQALAVSGLLSRTMYGPPVRPPQPELGLKAAFGGKTDWQTSEGEDRYRRGIYTSWRRSNPYPSMAAFDAPNREFCTIRRANTNTPLQALVTLNDPVYIEAAQALGRRMMEQAGSAEEKVSHGFRLCLIRPPDEREVSALVRLFEKTKSHYGNDLEAARTMATDPLGDLPGNADVADAAAWTVVGNALLNLDEMFLKR